MSTTPESRPATRPARAPRPDTALMEAVDAAREGLHGIAAEGSVGEHTGARSVGERLVTHTFTCLMPGYTGWQWEVTLARAPRSRRVTVCEAHLSPAEGALLAPEWVPWADRLRPEDFGVADAKAEEAQLVLVAPQALPVRPGGHQPERVAARCEQCDCTGYLVPVEVLRADRAALAEPEPDPLPDPLVDEFELEVVDLSEVEPEASGAETEAGAEPSQARESDADAPTTAEDRA